MSGVAEMLGIKVSVGSKCIKCDRELTELQDAWLTQAVWTSVDESGKITRRLDWICGNCQDKAGEE